jgi:hypothetical protein
MELFMFIDHIAKWFVLAFEQVRGVEKNLLLPQGIELRPPKP